MSFLNKLKRQIDTIENKEEGGKKEIEKEKKAKKSSDFSEIDVDICETPTRFYIYALIPGVDPEKIDISIEEENDVIVIQGRKESPALKIKETYNHHHQECQWGEFYRQIILPQEIDIARIEATAERGILILLLTKLRIQSKGIKKIAIKEKAED